MKKLFVYIICFLTASIPAYSQTLKYDGEEFTLREVEIKCEIYRYSDNYGDLECRGLRFLNRKCEAYFSNRNQRNGNIECRESDLRMIARRCTVRMNSERVPEYGEVRC